MNDYLLLPSFFIILYPIYIIYKKRNKINKIYFFILLHLLFNLLSFQILNAIFYNNKYTGICRFYALTLLFFLTVFQIQKRYFLFQNLNLTLNIIVSFFMFIILEKFKLEHELYLIIKTVFNTLCFFNIANFLNDVI